jgi:hypothetical protein
MPGPLLEKAYWSLDLKATLESRLINSPVSVTQEQFRNLKKPEDRWQQTYVMM